MRADFDFYTSNITPFRPLRSQPMGHQSLPIDTLQIKYCDFAYGSPSRRGPFRMAQSNIADTTARVFAEYVYYPFPSLAPRRLLARVSGGGDGDNHTLVEDLSSPNHPMRAPASQTLLRTALTNAEASARNRLLSGPMVDIYVGETKRHWSLHRNLLAHHSSYFENQFPDDGKAAKKGGGKLDLLDTDPSAFELLVKWLYQGRIEDVSAMPMEKKWDYAEACQKLYFLCDKVALPTLKNFAIDQFRKGCHEAGLVPGPEEMKPVYEKTPAASPFRKLVSRIAARQIMDPESTNDARTYQICFEGQPDFAIDVINAIREAAGGKLFHDPTESGGCEYHEHGDGKFCDGR